MPPATASNRRPRDPREPPRRGFGEAQKHQNSTTAFFAFYTKKRSVAQSWLESCRSVSRTAPRRNLKNGVFRGVSVLNGCRQVRCQGSPKCVRVVTFWAPRGRTTFNRDIRTINNNKVVHTPSVAHFLGLPAARREARPGYSTGRGQRRKLTPLTGPRGSEGCQLRVFYSTPRWAFRKSMVTQTLAARPNRGVAHARGGRFT